VTARLLSVLLLGITGTAPVATPPPDPASAVPHDFHVTYGRMGIEGSVIQARLRFFQDDLALALRAYARDPEMALAVDPATDSLVTAYLDARFVVRAGAREATEAEVVASAPLPATILASGEEVDADQPVWWYIVEYVHDAPVARVHLDARVLLELFDDQRNILRIQYFPSEHQRTFYLTHGSSEARFAL